MSLKHEHSLEPLYILAKSQEVVVLKLKTVPIGTALGLRILRVIRRGAQAIYKGGGAVISLVRDVGGAQAKLSASNNKTTVQILHKQCSTPMAK